LTSTSTSEIKKKIHSIDERPSKIVYEEIVNYVEGLDMT